MSRFAILRIEKRSLQQASAMAQHALRDGQTVPNADPARTLQNVVLVGPRSAAEVMASIRAALPARYRKDAVTVVEALVTFSPEVTAEWEEQKQFAYLKEALAWIAPRFGGEWNIKSAIIHLDETTPHLQILLVPLNDGCLRANKFIGGPAGLRRLQSLFADEVGASYGLSRGMPRPVGGPRITHQAVHRFYGAIGDDESASSLTNEQTAYWAKVGRMFAGYYGRGLQNRAKELLRLAQEQRAALARLRAEVFDATVQRDRLLLDNAALAERAAALASNIKLLKSDDLEEPHEAAERFAPSA